MSAKNLLIIFLISLITACSWLNVTPIKVKTEEIQRPKLDLDYPEPIQLQQIEWYLVTPETAQEVFTELQKSKNSIVVFGLSEKGYEDLSLNFSEIRKHIVHQRKIIKEYKDYYEPVDKSIEK